LRERFIPEKPYCMEWVLPKKLAFASLLALFLIQLGIIVFLNYDRPVSFDGAMNLQVAQSVSEGKGYGRYYNHWRLFPEEVQTNAPYVLPAAAIYRLFGVSFISSQIISFAYLFCLFVAVYCLVRLVSSVNLALLALVLIVFIPELSRFGLNGYGEIPALFWCLLGIIFLSRTFDQSSVRIAFLAGLCFALSLLTKTVLLLPVTVSLIVFGYFSIVRRQWAGFLSCSAGLILLIALHEIWRLSALGPSEWLLWWSSQIDAVTAQAGVSSAFSDTSNLFDKFKIHSAVFLQSVALSFPAALLLAIIPIAAFTAVFYSFSHSELCTKKLFVITVLICIALSYFLWWMLLTPTQKAWYRRIFNGWVLLIILVPMLIGFFYEARNRILQRSMTGLLCLPLCLFIWSSIQGYRFDAHDQHQHSLRQVIEFVQKQPPTSSYYGVGWYSAPAISLYSGVLLRDMAIQKYSLKLASDRHYVLVDLALSTSNLLDEALHGLNFTKVVAEEPWAAVYRLDSEFTPYNIETDNADSLLSKVAFRKNEYHDLEGFYPAESDGWRWASPRASILLAMNQGSEKLLIEGFIRPLYEYGLLADERFLIGAAIEGCDLGTQAIDRAGTFSLTWSLQDCPPVSQEFVQVDFRTDHALKDNDRVLSWIAELIEID